MFVFMIMFMMLITHIDNDGVRDYLSKGKDVTLRSEGCKWTGAGNGGQTEQMSELGSLIILNIPYLRRVAGEGILRALLC